MRLKRIIPIIFGLLAMLSSVAAVSAYEAHTINVVAHVENALNVDTTEFNLGGIQCDEVVVGQNPNGSDIIEIQCFQRAVFPEEWFETKRDVRLSSSFIAQDRVKIVDLVVVAECKPNPLFVPPNQAGVPPTEYPANWPHFAWMGEGMWLDAGDGFGEIGIHDPNAAAPDFDGICANSDVVVDLGLPGAGVPGCPNCLRFFQADLGAAGFFLDIGFDAPVFLPDYNEHTDICDKPRPNGFGPEVANKTADPYVGTPTHQMPVNTNLCQAPTWQIPENDPRHFNGDGVDLGIDIKIQVVCLGRLSIGPDDLSSIKVLNQCVPSHFANF